MGDFASDIVSASSAWRNDMSDELFRALQNFGDKFVFRSVNNHLFNHIECLKEGYTLTANKSGLWCSKDDPEPKQPYIPTHGLS